MWFREIDRHVHTKLFFILTFMSSLYQISDAKQAETV